MILIFCQRREDMCQEHLYSSVMFSQSFFVMSACSSLQENRKTTEQPVDGSKSQI